MKFGLSPLQAGGDFEETIRECERAEAAGFDSIWLGEHHDNRTLYPAPLLGLAAIAARTRRIRLGTAVLLLPLYHPLAVAEEAAMVDVISGGRLILGVGAGYAPEEFAAFGVSITERGSRLEDTYFRWPHPVVKRPAGTLTIERLAEDRIILGDPATCVEQLQRFGRELTLGHVVCRVSAPGIPRDAVMRSMDLLTREVLPACR